MSLYTLGPWHSHSIESGDLIVSFFVIPAYYNLSPMQIAKKLLFNTIRNQ